MARSLWPREHGAYVQLGAPLVAALVTGVTDAALLLALAACCAFLANEPLLVLLGHRGQRVQASHGSRARRRLIVIVALAVGAGIGGLAMATPATLRIAAIACVPALALVGLAVARAERTLAGELVAAFALAGTAAPVAVAAGWSIHDAVVTWLAWSIGYASTVIAVHRVIDRHRRPSSPRDVVIVVVLTVVLAASLLVATWHASALVAGPLVLAATVLVLHPPSAGRLRAVGVGLLVTSLGSAALASVTHVFELTV